MVLDRTWEKFRQCIPVYAIFIGNRAQGRINCIVRMPGSGTERHC